MKTVIFTKSSLTKLLLVAMSMIALVGYSVATAPQQNVSGGGSVSIVQGGNTANVSAAGALKVDGSAVTQPVSGTFWQATQPVSGTVTVNPLPAGSNNIGKVNALPLDGCGGTNYDSGLLTLPTAATVVTATNTCVQAIGLMNVTSSAQTCTITDGQGSPVTVLSSYQIPANSTARFVFDGVKFLTGIKWSCTNATSVTGYVRGTQ
jgi:hypothetical protein